MRNKVTEKEISIINVANEKEMSLQTSLNNQIEEKKKNLELTLNFRINTVKEKSKILEARLTELSDRNLIVIERTVALAPSF